MPQAIPAAVAFVATAFSSAVAVVSGTLTAIGVTAVIGEGAAIALAGGIIKTAGLLALSTASAALMRPSTPSSGSALDFKPDPKAPVRGLMGYHATGGNKVFQSTWGYNGVALSMGVALSLGPIDTITRFEADNSAVSFFGPQGEASGFYNRDMWQLTSRGLPTDTALQIPTGFKYETPHISDWGPSNAAKGVAFAFWTLVTAKNPEDREVFTNGVPDPRWIGRWMKVYDWRKDSTYPGGSGSQREDDWRTWEWSENPYVHARAWLSGHFKMNDDGTLDRQKLIAGVGVGTDSIDMPAFTEAANIADANAWKISGEWSTTDDKAQVLFAMMQAGSGRVIPRGAQISVMVNAPRVSTYTVTRDDVLGQASIRPLTRRRERKNTIVPRYRSETHNWEYVAAKDVTSSVYRAEDRGEPRSTEIQYTYVRDAKQAAELAAYDLVNLREGLSITVPAKVHLMHVHPGDCITINVPEMALTNQKVIVLRSGFDAKSGVATLECRSETDGKHAFAMGQIAEPPPSPSLSAVDPAFIPAPLPEDWDVVVKPPSSDGTSQPIIIVTGPIDRGDIASTIVEYGPTGTGPWEGSAILDPAAGKYQITGLNPGETYYVSIRYVANNGTISPRYVSGPYVAGDLSADISEGTKDQIINDVLDQIGDIVDQAAEVENLAEAVLDDIVNQYRALWREQELKNEGVAIAYQSSQVYTDEFEARATMTFATIAALDDGLAATLNQSEAYTNGTVATAFNLVYTKAETDAGLANTLSLSKSYTDDEFSQAELLFATKTERENGDAQTLIAAKSYTDDYKSTANLTFATISSLNGVNATAGLALSSAVTADGKASAIVGLVTDVDGVIGGFSSVNDGVTTSFKIQADRFAIKASGSGARTEYQDGIWYSYNSANTVRSSWGKPHGSSGDIVWWTGLNSVPKGSENRSSAYVYVATSAPRFGGSDTPTPGGGSSGSAVGRKESTSNSFNTGGAWATVETITPAGVPPSPYVTVGIEWIGSPSVSNSGTWNGQIRVVETATNNVIGSPEAISITHNTEPTAVTLFGDGLSSGSVQYSLQVFRSSGSNNVSSIGFAMNFDAYQRL